MRQPVYLCLAAILGGATPFARTRVVTFSKDIAPIVFDQCASCHRPGGGAPFSLLTYDDARRRATLIKRVTERRYMPPWKAEPGHGDFAGERRLTDAQLALIQQWVDGGSPEGDRRDLPVTPQWPGAWRLGTPDLVVTMPEPYQLGADGVDVFRTFVVRIPIAVRRYVRAFEFHPGTPAAVHHASIKIDRTRSSRQLDEEEPGPGYDGGGGRNAAFPDGHFLSWTQGQLPYRLPEGMAWRLEPDSDLVLELHMMPTGKAEAVQASVGLFFTDEAPARTSYIVRLGSQSIDIPAGENAYVVNDTFELPVDVDVLGVQPHAHYLAKEIKAFARLPDGTTTWLLHIRDWDFRWQDVYRYREPVRLPKGTTLSMRYVYDNSSANIRNPNRPPKRVMYGQTTSSEMGNLWIQVVPRHAEDLEALDRAHAPKVLREDIAGYEKMLEQTPRDPRLHTDLAFLYLSAERVADAMTELQEAVHLAPDSSSPHYALGTLLLSQKRFEEAKTHFNAAIRLKPNFSEAYNNLGVMNDAQGKLDAAIADYAAALRLEPENVQARYNLGRALAAQGKFEEATVEYRQVLKVRPDDVDSLSSLASVLVSRGQVDEAVTRYRRALELNPNLTSALIDLAWILATSARADIHAPREAVRLAERVAVLTNYGNATVLDALAVAYFSAGRTADAIRTLQTAIDVASRTGPEGLADHFRQRLESYRQQIR